MDIIAILTELSKSKEPYAVLDKHFKNDDPNANALLNIDELVEQVHIEVVDEMRKHAIESWMSEKDKQEMIEFIDAQFRPKLAELKAGLLDGVNRNYDMKKYIEFIKKITTSVFTHDK